MRAVRTGHMADRLNRCQLSVYSGQWPEIRDQASPSAAADGEDRRGLVPPIIFIVRRANVILCNKRAGELRQSRFGAGGQGSRIPGIQSFEVDTLRGALSC